MMGVRYDRVGGAHDGRDFPKPKGPAVRPDRVVVSPALPVTGSSMIRREHIQWIQQEGFTDVISLEPIDAETIVGLEGIRVNHHPFPVKDADDGPYMNDAGRRRLTELVKGIMDGDPKANILIHCMDCEGRTPEAMRTLEAMSETR